MTANADIISQYREQKKNMDQLAAAARKQMQARYEDLLVEAAQIRSEFKDSFGELPTLPPAVKAFTIGEPTKPAATQSDSLGKKIGGLKRSLAAAMKNNQPERVAEVSAQLAALGVTVNTAPPEPAPAETPAPAFEV